MIFVCLNVLRHVASRIMIYIAKKCLVSSSTVAANCHWYQNESNNYANASERWPGCAHKGSRGKSTAVNFKCKEKYIF